jgi:hypothetical protein
MMLVPMVAICMAECSLPISSAGSRSKLAAVALSTAKSEIAQPLYAIIRGWAFSV